VRVRFDPTVLDDDASWIELDRVLDAIVGDSRDGSTPHVLEIDDVDALLRSRWLTHAPTHYRSQHNAELAKKLALKEAYVPADAFPERIVVCSSSSLAQRPGRCLTPAEASSLLRRPLVVIVENADSDKRFVVAMAFAFSRTTLSLAIERGWCRFEGGGGCGEIEKAARRQIESGQQPWRIVALIDGDCWCPEDRPSKLAVENEQKCRAIGVDCRALHKRDSENYIPLDVLRKHAPSTVVDAFARLCAHQVDHFDMKKGFSDKAPFDDARYRGLFAGVPEADRVALSKGFTKHIGERCFDDVAAFSRASIERACRTRPGEINDLLAWIERKL
jgi:hypothetical protein